MLLGRRSGGVSWLLVCLGNPGINYTNTRHNVGFHAADAMAARQGISVTRFRFHAMTDIAVIGGERVLVMKPQTMMNLSGSAAAQAAHFYRIPPERIIVIFDDISLPVGKLRIRPRGSAGGHNGIRDMIEQLGSSDFPRIKIGVGEKPTPDYDLVRWVLGRPTQREWELINGAIDRGLDAVESIITEGIDSAMNKYNG